MTDHYRAWARYYDQIYHWKPYGEEAVRVRRLLHDAGVTDGARVLEAACGTGAYLRELKAWFDIEGFDVSETMLAVARERVPDVHTFQADMTDFEVEEPYDALLCLFSSIGYVMDAESLASTARSFAAALRPGGSLIIEPWVDPEAYVPGRPTQHTYESEDLKLCRSVVGRREGDRAILEFHWLVTRRDEGVEHFVDTHTMWLCPRDPMRQLFVDAGFECAWEDDGLMPGRGLLLGTKR